MKKRRIFVLGLIIFCLFFISLIEIKSYENNKSSLKYVEILYDRYLSTEPKNCYLLKNIKFENDNVYPYSEGRTMPLSKIQIGDNSKITVQIMNLSEEEVHNIKIKTSLVNSKNGEYLLIDNLFIYMDSLKGGKGTMSEVFQITVTAVKNTYFWDFSDIIINELYVDNELQDCELTRIEILSDT